MPRFGNIIQHKKADIPTPYLDFKGYPFPTTASIFVPRICLDERYCFFAKSHHVGKSDSHDQKQQEPGKPRGSFSPSETQYSTMDTEKLEQLERTPETFPYFSTWAQRTCLNFAQQVYKQQSPVSTSYLIRMAQILVISILSSLAPLGRN